jgi:hypothetical protein
MLVSSHDSGACAFLGVSVRLTTRRGCPEFQDSAAPAKFDHKFVLEVFLWLTLKKLYSNPGLVFKTPQELLENNELSRQQKIEILRRWEYDVRQLQVAAEESMEGPQPVTLEAVLRALRAIGAPADPERSAPTKQGGSR